LAVETGIATAAARRGGSLIEGLAHRTLILSFTRFTCVSLLAALIPTNCAVFFQLLQLLPLPTVTRTCLWRPATS
jgi:hypothetical protein